MCWHEVLELNMDLAYHNHTSNMFKIVGACVAKHWALKRGRPGGYARLGGSIECLEGLMGEPRIVAERWPRHQE